MPRGRESILVVEDQDVLRELLGELLVHLGYKVLQAVDGQAALAAVTGHAGQIDLVVTDVVMPGMSGLEFQERLASIRPGTKMLLMSGYSDAVVSRHGGLAPGTAFIAKPFFPSELATKVRALLDSA